MIIAIDGPSGVGKGTLAKLLAKELKLSYLDTGLLYRSLGLLMIKKDLDLNDEEKAVILSKTIDIDMFGENELRSDIAAKSASIVSKYKRVREELLNYQRDFSKKILNGKKGVVLDGRDIGTVICPNADFKFFITASVKARAKRRFKELQNRGINSIYEDVLCDLQERDKRDTSRNVCPLKPAIDAQVIDTSELSAKEVLEYVMSIIKSYKN